MAARQAKPKQKAGDRLRLLAAAALVAVLIAVLGYRIYSRVKPPPQAARKPKTVVVRERRGAASQDQNIRVQRRGEKSTEDWREKAAEDWREKALDIPEEERMSSDGTVLVPAIKVYEDKDVYLPLRIMVKKGEADEDVPFWKKNKEPTGPPPLTD